jgi:hypothetical protein
VAILVDDHESDEQDDSYNQNYYGHVYPVYRNRSEKA